MSTETEIARLDTEYQAAVERNDAETMDRILADDFVLVTGLGKTFTKEDLLEEARSGRVEYEFDTAVITAQLWAKGVANGEAFHYKLWFSDTYVRSDGGWRYVFGQASTRQAP